MYRRSIILYLGFSITFLPFDTQIVDDLMLMKELLKEGLNVDTKDRHGKTTVQVAMAVDNTRFSWEIFLAIWARSPNS